MDRHDVAIARQAMIAVLDQGELRIGRTDRCEGLETVLPRHVGILIAMQDAQRTLKIYATTENEMLGTILDELSGDRIGIAITAGPQPHAVALERCSCLWI